MPIYDVLHSEECRLFRNELRNLLKASGLSQVQISERLHQPKSYMSKCLTGERRIGVTELYQICRVAEVSMSEFISALEPKWDELNENSESLNAAIDKKEEQLIEVR